MDTKLKLPVNPVYNRKSNQLSEAIFFIYPFIKMIKDGKYDPYEYAEIVRKKPKPLLWKLNKKYRKDQIIDP